MDRIGISLILQSVKVALIIIKIEIVIVNSRAQKKEYCIPVTMIQSRPDIDRI